MSYPPVEFVHRGNFPSLIVTWNRTRVPHRDSNLGPLGEEGDPTSIRPRRAGQAAPGECILLHRENGSSTRVGEPCAEAVNKVCSVNKVYSVKLELEDCGPMRPLHVVLVLALIAPVGSKWGSEEPGCASVECQGFNKC